MNAKKIQRELQQPFAPSDLEWRVQASGKYGDKIWCRVLAYVTNRAIQQRFDDVVGVFGWKNEFAPLPNAVGDGALCGISIKFEAEWITKFDGADNTAIEATKGGLSGSMKRAAVEWGPGRYLYDIDAIYATVITEEAFKKLQRHEKDKYEKAKLKDSNVWFYWMPPELEDRFLPKKHIKHSELKMLEKLAIETETKEEDILKNYGVDDLRDLFIDEAGEAVSMLLKKKERMEANETDKTDKS